MGRYAFFSSEFEYKFAFGIQGSLDIMEFGGEDISDYDYENDIHLKCPRHEWVKNDMEYILEKLKDISLCYGFSMPDFNSVKKTCRGTYKLIDSIDEKHKNYHTHYIGEAYYRFILGCCIYHQLMYNDHLTAEYEI